MRLSRWSAGREGAVRDSVIYQDGSLIDDWNLQDFDLYRLQPVAEGVQGALSKGHATPGLYVLGH